MNVVYPPDAVKKRISIQMAVTRVSFSAKKATLLKATKPDK